MTEQPIKDGHTQQLGGRWLRGPATCMKVMTTNIKHMKVEVHGWRTRPARLHPVTRPLSRYRT